MSTSTYLLRSLVPWPFPRLSFCIYFSSRSCSQERVRHTYPHTHTSGIGCKNSRGHRCKNSCGSQVPPETPIRGEFGGGSFVWVSLLVRILFVCLFILFSVVVLEEKTQGEIWAKVIDWQSVLWNYFFGGELCRKPNEFVLKSPYQNNLP